MGRKGLLCADVGCSGAAAGLLGFRRETWEAEGKMAYKGRRLGVESQPKIRGRVCWSPPGKGWDCSLDPSWGLNCWARAGAAHSSELCASLSSSWPALCTDPGSAVSMWPVCCKARSNWVSVDSMEQQGLELGGSPNSLRKGLSGGASSCPHMLFRDCLRRQWSRQDSTVHRLGALVGSALPVPTRCSVSLPAGPSQASCLVTGL